MEGPDSEENSPTGASDIAYAYKPSLMGAPFEFGLTSHALEWRRGTRGNARGPPAHHDG